MKEDLRNFNKLPSKLLLAIKHLTKKNRKSLQEIDHKCNQDRKLEQRKKINNMN